MIWLIAGLVLFFSIHSSRIFADSWRTRCIQVKGENVWKGIYSLLSIVGLLLIIYGYGLSRADPVFLWTPPTWTRHLASLLVLFSFFLLAAAYVPGNHIKARLGHPMYAGIKIWAFSHLITNGRLGDTLLFGCFLVWAIVGFSSARRRDRLAGTVYMSGTAKGTVITFVAGFIAYGVFASYLHRVLIGVPPF